MDSSRTVKEKEPDRVLLPGKPNYDRVDNKVVTARYTLLTFLPLSIFQQFRRFSNLYFLIMGIIMAIGQYTNLFETALSPWTVFIPLSIVMSVSLALEGYADFKRHVNDSAVNRAPCVVLRRSDELDQDKSAKRDDQVLHGQDVMVNINKAYLDTTTTQTDDPQQDSFPALDDSEASSNDRNKVVVNVAVGFEKIRRMDIRQGHIVFLKNREMAPADMILLASSNNQGSAYIETSSIDGETNLKLRTSPHLPQNVLRQLTRNLTSTDNNHNNNNDDSVSPSDQESTSHFETLEEAVQRLTRFSYLGHPEGTSALEHPKYTNNKSEDLRNNLTTQSSFFSFAAKKLSEFFSNLGEEAPKYTPRHISGSIPDSHYITALTTEPPNPSVHTFQGKLTLPPLEVDAECLDIPLGADHVLLRGAVLRNTQWAIGVAFFTGTDTKLVRNSTETPSKFSRFDIVMNYIVVAIVILMISLTAFLSTAATVSTSRQFDSLWYCGYNKNTGDPWPYLPNLPPPNWRTKQNYWIQYFFLYLTLLYQFVPLSLYVTVEIITFTIMWFISVDQEMYDPISNTRAAARSTAVTDLGRIQYIFSDKTGTLTQNVMTFQRCSVDGMVFGPPVKKKSQGDDEKGGELKMSEGVVALTPFLPLRHLLVGRFQSSDEVGSSEVGSSEVPVGQELTFNAEMFLRIMSLCHTVVVEKDLDKIKEIRSASSNVAEEGGGGKSVVSKFFRLGRSKSEDSRIVNDTDGAVAEVAKDENITEKYSGTSENYFKSPDGAPLGYAYQAESPDEGALVSAASLTFGFQLVSRDSSGIKIRLSKPSHFQNPRIVDGLKSGELTIKRLVAETASEKTVHEPHQHDSSERELEEEYHEECWSILAVNKFDSTRKRMSILLRSPSELGSIPILFCKGADTGMLDPEVCSASRLLQTSNAPDQGISHEGSDDVVDDVDQEGWEMAQILGVQTHLGEFASEGLRTLVLGLRVLTEAECAEWMALYHLAVTSMVNRETLTMEAALAIEKNLHIVGATAIEDKLQKGVPQTISNLGKAGIKLWVLTGDKKETAINIGYSTAVLTPKMSLTEVVDQGQRHVQTKIAMEFIRLVKAGKLPDYQKSALDKKQCRDSLIFRVTKIMRAVVRFFNLLWAGCLRCCYSKESAERAREKFAERLEAEKSLISDQERRSRVRESADSIINQWLESRKSAESSTCNGPQGANTLPSITEDTETSPKVFDRASGASSRLSDLRASGKMAQADLRLLSLNQKTLHDISQDRSNDLRDEDTWSVQSFFPEGNKEDLQGNFDKKRRTWLERAFAVDRHVRKGQLKKHIFPHKLADLESFNQTTRASTATTDTSDGPRALVIEGAALKHILGRSDLEGMLFAVTSVCDSVIACRVSPKQKAQLVSLVRHNVRPTPMTLAIGDGANDVGMIKEAHVGIGISGKEGTQAVNASDFAISQFRFLETLILIHGRWDFFRLSTVVLFSFYKNAVQAGIMVLFNFQTVFSGQPYFDQWLQASLNFVCGVPIIFTGVFDRCLSKDYVRKNPEVYRASCENELITGRTFTRWAIITVTHICTLYFFTAPISGDGGGMTSSFLGLMRYANKSDPGNGEGGDWKSVGTLTFTCMIILNAYKVLYETRSLIHGRWPAFTCSASAKEKFSSRLAYTWVGVVWLSLVPYFAFICVYQLFGQFGAMGSGLSEFVDVANHVLGTRSLNWMLIAFVPIFAIVFDVTFKAFSNMYFPTQTQVHMEIEAENRSIRDQSRRKLLRGNFEGEINY